MKPELLSPAGDFECLASAIAAGADAVYIGGKLFGARAFSSNFSNEEIIEAINYAHLYGVKVYVTINTLIYENEINKFLNYVDFLHKNNVDALIIQDIGMMDLVRKTYPNLELHASTQMHIHNLEGTKLLESLGLKRVVLARETSIDTIKKIKENTNIELEIFIQGALCISYSGQCLFSSLIGNRSGNRGTCAGSCRQKYNLIEIGKRINKDEYLLSTKDLCSLETIGDLIDIGVNSFKIEGRMKSKEYVYLVTKIYRKAIDSYLKNKKVIIDDNDIKDLKKIFNREFTKGFLNNTDNNDIVNQKTPNHQGIEIGKVIKWKDNYLTIKLTDELSINDGIRIKEDNTGFIVTNMFKDRIRINTAKNEIISIYCEDKVTENSTILKTTDYLLNKSIDKEILENNRKVLINGKIKTIIGEPLYLEITDGKNNVIVTGNTVEKSIKCPIEHNRILEQINKLGDSVYKFNNLEIIGDKDIFISIKELNELRRKAVDKLNEERLYRTNYIKKEYNIELPDFKKEENINALLPKEYYEILKDKFNIIYSEDIIDNTILKLDRVINKYEEYDDKILVGELGSVYKYKNIDTDFSLNVTNSYSVALLHNLGVNKITLSYELSDNQIKDIITNYEKRYNKHPNLEVIVYGKEEAMISKFDLNKYYNTTDTYLQDRFNNLYKIVSKNNLMRIYNYKARYLKENYFNIGINNIRYNILDKDDINIF